MERKTRIERFIENYPIQFGDELREMLTRFKKSEISREEVEEITKSKIGMALNTIKPEELEKEEL